MNPMIAILGPALVLTASCETISIERLAPTSLHLATVQHHLTQQWGHQFDEGHSPHQTTRHGSVNQPSGGRLSAILAGRIPGQVRTISCQAYGSPPATATDFLRACASLPFPNQPATVLPTPNWPRYHRTTINGIHYRLTALPEKSLWVLRLAMPDSSPLP
ncbi:hypothetical protein GCM10009555_044680 [Acrocarpospora macrocephala]|uniref:Uncharacterized protein n=1 Tax=Acrocarpospora macrocephala TaxID=150177 RepID=A0A5M3WEX6_9ACTN|nr:hypothetical protein [Acrocarpospora macrocephala]GES06869.1 hypothetical protein Amac_004640 [Acrocarpospora macrocephala]